MPSAGASVSTITPATGIASAFSRNVAEYFGANPTVGCAAKRCFCFSKGSPRSEWAPEPTSIPAALASESATSPRPRRPRQRSWSARRRRVLYPFVTLATRAETCPPRAEFCPSRSGARGPTPPALARRPRRHGSTPPWPSSRRPTCRARRERFCFCSQAAPASGAPQPVASRPACSALHQTAPRTREKSTTDVKSDAPAFAEGVGLLLLCCQFIS
jgi:hypothetical protein